MEEINKKRISYMDSLKGFAIICVVLGHVVHGILSSQNYPADYSSLLNNLHDAIYSFHMPLFFLISGYFFCLAYIDDAYRPKTNKLKWQIGNIVILYFLFTVVLNLFRYLMSQFVNTPASLESVLYCWHHSETGYWYLYVLVLLYVFFALTYRVLSRWWVLLIVWMFFSFASLFIYTDAFELNRFLRHAPFFLLGMAVQRKMVKVSWWMSLVIVIAFFVEPLQKFFLALGISVLLFKMFESIKFLDNKFFSICGRYCLQIYLVHFFFTAGFRTLLPKIGLECYPLLLILNTVLSTAIPICIALVLQKIKLDELVYRPAYFIKRLITK